MKILAAVMDVRFVRLNLDANKRWDFYRKHILIKKKKFLVYDPSKVTPWDYGKKEE